MQDRCFGMSLQPADFDGEIPSSPIITWEQLLSYEPITLRWVMNLGPGPEGWWYRQSEVITFHRVDVETPKVYTRL